MYDIVILPIALQDIKDAADWYNQKQPGLGKRFAAQVRKKMTLIKKAPFNYATRYDDVKTAVLDVFPFMTHYTVYNSQKIIVISAILHTSRNPDYWKKEDDNFNETD